MSWNAGGTRARWLYAAPLSAAIFGTIALASVDAPAKELVATVAPTLAPRALVQAEVSGVADGDTLFVVLGGARRSVRLARIDAPEKRQAFGHRSERSLRQLVWKKTVTLQWDKLDRYGRPIANVSVDGLDVNAEQVKRGMAWVYLQYSRDAHLLALEQQARAARLGLWEQPEPVAPWQWRSDRVGRSEAQGVGVN